MPPRSSVTNTAPPAPPHGARSGAQPGGQTPGQPGANWQPLAPLWPELVAWMREQTRRTVAWALVVALVGVGTFASLQGVCWPAGCVSASFASFMPFASPDHGQVFAQWQGTIVAMRDDRAIALRMVDRRTGRATVVWLQLMPDSHLSMAHLRRHLHNHAGTDVRVRMPPSPGDRHGSGSGGSGGGSGESMPQVVWAD